MDIRELLPTKSITTSLMWNNKYPDKSLCYVTVSNTANSIDNLTLDYLKKVHFPAVGAVDGVLDGGLLLDASRGHYELGC